MECNGGPAMRDERQGIQLFFTDKAVFINIVFQSIVLEVFHLQFLIAWCIQIHGHGIQKLPTIEDMDSLLDFMDPVMDANSWMTLKNLLQSQYEIDEGFESLPSFRRTLLFLRDTLPRFCEQIVENALSSSVERNSDLFGRTRSQLETLLKDDRAVGGNGRKLPFHCQHILMNCNKLISDWPFGYPKKMIIRLRK
jgi:hypothetical protein